MKRAVIVLGVPRSGTSLLCQSLERLGVSFGEPLIPGDKANPWGYYENRTLVNLMTLLVHDWCRPRTWYHDGPLIMKNVASSHRDQLVRELSRQKNLFGWKTPYAQRLPAFIDHILGAADFEPVYVHAVRDPAYVFQSTLKANATESKGTMENWHTFLGVWSRMLLEARGLEPVCEVWFDEWRNVGAQGTLDKLSSALHLPYADAAELLKE